MNLSSPPHLHLSDFIAICPPLPRHSVLAFFPISQLIKQATEPGSLTSFSLCLQSVYVITWNILHVIIWLILLPNAGLCSHVHLIKKVIPNHPI